MILYRLVWLFVLLPTSLVSAFWIFMGAAALSNHELPWANRIVLFALLVLGGFGLFTLSRLDNHFRNGAQLGDKRTHLIGLAAGAIASIALFVMAPHQFISLWPLLAAGYFVVRLRGLRHAA